MVGIRFRPAGARPWRAGAMSDLADLDTAVLQAAVQDAPDAEAAAALVDAALRPHRPTPDPVDRVAVLGGLVDAERGIRWVDDLAERAGLSVRGVDRARPDGADPLIPAARAAAGPVDRAAPAAELCCADQAHLTRAFSWMVGESPARYARAQH
jgi:hypothetical protein